jgi:4a-hydroxytetrahydrobiopterin dehydratase
MQIQTEEELTGKKCRPCEGGIAKYMPQEAREQLQRLPGWRLAHGEQRIRRDWVVRNFVEGIRFFQQVAELAEQEGHHPDLHLERYRNVWIELWTHAIGGLSENDFILAAKIDLVPVKLAG